MKGLHEQFIVDKSGKKMAVILPIEDYEELLEDVHDLAVIAERKDEPTTGFEGDKKEVECRLKVLELMTIIERLCYVFDI